MSLERDVEHFTNKNITPQELADQLYTNGEIYLRNQIFDNSDDRRIELAFHNEALRSPKLSKLLIRIWQLEINRIVELYQTIGTSAPLQDAEVTFALVLQLEKKAMLIQDKVELAVEFEKMKDILKQHINLVLGVESNYIG